MTVASNRATPLSQEGFAEWINRFYLQFGCIDLFGTDSVRETAREAKLVIGEIGGEAREESARADDFVGHFIKAYRKHRERLDKVVGQTTEAMRVDLLADTEPENS